MSPKSFEATLLGRLSGIAGFVATAVVIAAIAAVVVVLRPDQERTSVSVDFPRTVSLYEGSEVRILGVAVGQVETVQPQGETVRVELWWDAEYPVPKDATAAIITPSIVGDRYVQLSPAYTSGPTMADGATLGMEQAAVPLELDEIYQSIDDLSVALGPSGANADGALSDLVDASAENLDGNGAKLRSTIRDLSLLSGTLANNKDELFGSVSQVQRFVNALAVNDGAVRDFNRSLAEVSVVLEGEREDLAAAVESLGGAMRDVRGFVQENGDALSSNVRGLVRVTDTLVNQRDALTEVLDTAPLALSNLAYAYNGRTGTLDQRTNFGPNEEALLNDPRTLICSLLSDEPDGGQLCDSGLGDVLDLLAELQRGRAGPFEEGPRYVEEQDRDTTLSQMVGMDR